MVSDLVSDLVGVCGGAREEGGGRIGGGLGGDLLSGEQRGGVCEGLRRLRA